MKTLFQIQLVKRFRKLQGDLAIINITNQILINDEIIYKSDKPLLEIYCEDGKYLFTNTSAGNGLKIELNTKKTQYFEDIFIRKIKYPIHVLIKNDQTIFEDLNKKISVIFDFTVFVSLLDFNKVLLVIFNKAENAIITYDIFSKIVKSNFTLSNLGNYRDGIEQKPYQVSVFAGLYNNTLVCSLNSGEILLLDIQKGEVIAFFKDTRLRDNLYQKGIDSPIFYGFNSNRFIEINAEKAKVVRIVEMSEQLKACKNMTIEDYDFPAVRTSFYENGLIYFMALNDLIGVFDPESEQIIDSYVFSFEKKGTFLQPGKENLQVSGNEIYVLDSENTLHILERD